MVAPLIIGAARVARTKSSLKKSERRRVNTSPIASQRYDRIYSKEAIVNRPKDRKRTLERQAQNVRSIRDILSYRHALKTAGKSSGKSKIKKVKALNRGIMTLGALAYPMMVQSLFAILFMASLALEDNFWTGWAVPGITLASVLWVMIIAIGSYTMITAGFALAKYLKNIYVVLAFMICFILNWVPFFFIVPWTGIWIAYVIKKQ